MKIKQLIYSKKKVLFLILSLLLATIFITVILCCRKNRSSTPLQPGEYDTILLSMFPVNTYPLNLFYDYRLMTVLAADDVFPDSESMDEYLKQTIRDNKAVSTVYLGFLPDKVTLRELSKLTKRYPSITFELIMAYPSSDYWQKLSEQDYQQVLDAYCNCLTEVSCLKNANLYFFGSCDFLISNPALYRDDFLVSEDAGFFIVANSSKDCPYLVTGDNCTVWVNSLQSVTKQLRSTPIKYPDYSDKTIVFLGDSIIGFFNGGLSVPGVVNGLTNATAFNIGFGGATAAANNQAVTTLPDMLRAFYAKDADFFSETTQAHTDLSRYWESEIPEDSSLCFVLNYGINDYFCNSPISSGDPYNVNTFTGALRVAVSEIRQSTPNAQIILCTPIYNPYMLDYPDGVTLESYVNAILALSVELEVDVADNYHNCGITEDNYTQYLPDLVHPNEAGRFLIGKCILQAIRP